MQRHVKKIWVGRSCVDYPTQNKCERQKSPLSIHKSWL